jgi:hypothetical protein
MSEILSSIISIITGAGDIGRELRQAPILWTLRPIDFSMMLVPKNPDHPVITRA